MDNIFLIWTNQQSRVENLSKDIVKDLGSLKVFYNKNPHSNKLKKILLYLVYFLTDFNRIYKYKPKRIFVQTPPSYALLAPYFYKKFINRNCIIISDLHNAMFRNPWLSRLGTKRLLSISDVLICHNNIIYKTVLSDKLFNDTLLEKLHILEDKTPEKSSEYLLYSSDKTNTPIVFFPASFNDDEPITEVLKAAFLLPNLKIIMTGNKEKLKKNFNIKTESLPANVEITGWVDELQYERLLYSCDILLGLTIHDDIQMSVSNEGLGAEKVMVLSNTEALRSIYKNGATYCNNNAASISQSIKDALDNYRTIEVEIRNVKKIKEERYLEQWESVKDTILSLD